ncbi:hypothetical protein WA026_009062 [Henosepilachna vigintioctopunctata]|uniref:Uncharacterized protein n=1 Tax=Henosepilachna vigintioctopunctata TaxID=420089 RepID=A0AAW1UWG6_9CUCU
MDRCEIKETLKAAECYLQKLKDLDEEIKSAQAQIVNTSKEAEKTVCCHLTSLADSLVQTLSKRKNDLLQKISTLKLWYTKIIQYYKRTQVDKRLYLRQERKVLFLYHSVVWL